MNENKLKVNPYNLIPGVSIIVSTNKPHFMDNILNNYDNQVWKKKELIIILNKNELDLYQWKAKARKYNNVFIYKVDERVSLGECLNFAVKNSNYEYIAKFDDDDFYAPNYLIDSLKAFKKTKADIVGKRSYYTYLEEDKMLMIRFPQKENQYQKLVTGSTIMAKKKVFKSVKFKNLNLGEDFNFLDDCRKRGFKIYSVNRFNYVYIRRKNTSNHTWKPEKKYLLATGKFVAYTDDYKGIAVK